MLSIIRPLLLSLVLVNAPSAFAGDHDSAEVTSHENDGNDPMKRKKHPPKKGDLSSLNEIPVEDWPIKAQDHESTLLNMIKARSTERYEAMMALRAEGGEPYVQALQKISNMVMKREKAAERRAKQEARERRQAYKEAIDAALDGYNDLNKREKAERRAELTEIAVEVYTFRQQERRKNIAALEKALSELEQKVSAAENDQETMIEDWVNKKVTSVTE